MRAKYSLPLGFDMMKSKSLLGLVPRRGSALLCLLVLSMVAASVSATAGASVHPAPPRTALELLRVPGADAVPFSEAAAVAQVLGVTAEQGAELLALSRAVIDL